MMIRPIDGRNTSKQLATQHIATDLSLKKATNRKLTSSPSLAEIRDAIKMLKLKIAAGVDGIQAETAAVILYPHIATAWENEEQMQFWTKALIVKLPKKDALRDCGNWRGITLPPAKNTIKRLYEKISTGEALSNPKRPNKSRPRRSAENIAAVRVLRGPQEHPKNAVLSSCAWLGPLYNGLLALICICFRTIFN